MIDPAGLTRRGAAPLPRADERAGGAGGLVDPRLQPRAADVEAARVAATDARP